jgi:hypothetical protein
VSADDGADDTIAVGGAVTSAGHEEMLDPSTSERRYWRDPLSGIQREIWRPGKFTTTRSAEIHPLTGI